MVRRQTGRSEQENASTTHPESGSGATAGALKRIPNTLLHFSGCFWDDYRWFLDRISIVYHPRVRELVAWACCVASAKGVCGRCDDEVAEPNLTGVCRGEAT